MLPSVAVKYFYRNLTRHSTEIKYLHSLCFAAPRIFRQDIFHESKKLWRCVHTSTYLLDKPVSINALQPEKASPDGDSANKIIKQSVTGDIIVKTETDDNNVVTKVTIEKSKPLNLKKADKVEPQPGYFLIILMYLNSCCLLFMFRNVVIVLCNICHCSNSIETLIFKNKL